MSIKIIFEEREKRDLVVNEDCTLSSITIVSSALEKVSNLRTDRGTGTNVESKDVGIGASTLLVNKSTAYEFQKLDATRLHRASNDAKLTAFLQEVLPIVEEELHFSHLQRSLLTDIQNSTSSK